MNDANKILNQCGIGIFKPALRIENISPVLDYRRYGHVAVAGFLLDATHDGFRDQSVLTTVFVDRILEERGELSLGKGLFDNDPQNPEKIRFASFSLNTALIAFDHLDPKLRGPVIAHEIVHVLTKSGHDKTSGNLMSEIGRTDSLTREQCTAMKRSELVLENPEYPLQLPKRRF